MTDMMDRRDAASKSSWVPANSQSTPTSSQSAHLQQPFLYGWGMNSDTDPPCGLPANSTSKPHELVLRYHGGKQSSYHGP